MSTAPPLRIAVFDARRGNKEGRELDKVLCYFPSNTPEQNQINHVGFAQACSMFAEHFTVQEQDVYLLELDHCRWLVCNCEQDVWFMLVVSRQLATSSCTTRAMRAYISSLHSTFVLLHGPINMLLDQDPSSSLARLLLQQHVCEAAQRLAQPEAREAAALANPLGAAAACPFLPASRRCYTELQTLVSSISTCALHGRRPVLGTVVAYEQYVLWSTHSREDTAALWRLASSSLVPRSSSSSSSSSSWRQIWMFGGGSTVTRVVCTMLQSRPEAPRSASLMSPSAWKQQRSGFMMPGTDSTGSSSIGGGTSSASNSTGSAEAQLAAVYLQGGQDCCRLLPYRQGRLLVLLLLQEGQQLVPDLQALLLALLQPCCTTLCELLASEAPGSDTWHIKGHRYLFLDEACCMARYSPLAKVGTLSSSSLELLAEVRSELELELQLHSDGQCTQAQQQGSGSKGCATHTNSSSSSRKLHDAQLEVVCRAAHDCWVVGRVADRRHLLVAMEQRGEREGGFLAVSKAVQALGDVHFPGMFL